MVSKNGSRLRPKQVGPAGNHLLAGNAQLPQCSRLISLMSVRLWGCEILEKAACVAGVRSPDLAGVTLVRGSFPDSLPFWVPRDILL